MAKLKSKYGTRRPEDRRGTRSHRAYSKYLVSLGAQDERDGTLAAYLATARQYKKAARLAEQDIATPLIRGRVIRAVVRLIRTHQAHEADQQMGYGW